MYTGNIIKPGVRIYKKCANFFPTILSRLKLPRPRPSLYLEYQDKTETKTYSGPRPKPRPSCPRPRPRLHRRLILLLDNYAWQIG